MHRALADRDRNAGQCLDPTKAQADVVDRRALEAVAGRIQGEFGRVDILVNAAGVQVRKPSLEFTEEDWRFVLDVNLTGTFFACQVFGRGMVERRAGKIVNIGSLTSRIGLPGRVAYTASKGGVLLLTQTLAVEWAQHNVNVNAIGPGYFRTEMNTALFDDAAWVENVMRHIPMKREGLPPDLDGTVIYLCSAASDYLTGQIVYVDGGFLAGVEL
jgi:NAD(P)-dependent dehydrogenase (short-subunit alcohol dehydrogenase family)